MMGAPAIAAPSLLMPFMSAPSFTALVVITPAVLLGLSWNGSRKRRDDAKGGEGCDSLTHGFLHRMRSRL
jgi:hypothetical protein